MSETSLLEMELNRDDPNYAFLNTAMERYREKLVAMQRARRVRYIAELDCLELKEEMQFYETLMEIEKRKLRLRDANE